MFTWALLITSTACLSILGLYFLSYVVIALHQLFSKQNAITGEQASAKEITILIPSYNEGNSVIDTVESLKFQDVRSALYIDILIKDESDTSYAPLRKHYKNFTHNEFFKIAKKRFLRIHCTGLQLKNDKINAVLPAIDSPYVAFLDADHRATKSWLKDSLQVLTKTNTRIVQSKRGPLSLNGFFKAWDSLQNHIGNEVINRFLSRIGKTCYFTGTTCVFETELIRETGFPDSITEDTYLTYQMFSKGEKVSYNPHSGSFEEMAPDIHSYIARRRRWSCGHNQTCKDFLPSIFSLPGFSIGEKGQLFLHLFYYLLPVVIFIQQLFYGFYFLLQYSKDVQYLSLAVTFAIASLLCLLFSSKVKQFVQNFPLAFLWTLPFVSFVSVYVYKFSGNELYYQIASLPYTKTLFYLHITFLAAPLLLLIVGTVRLKRPSPWILTGVVLTYPLIVFLDIFASLVGFLDLVLQRREWGSISRSPDIDEDLKEIEVSLTGRRRKTNLLLIAALPFLAILLVLYNDLMPRDHCGYKEYLFGTNILFKLESDINVTNRITKTVDGDKVTVSIHSQITNPLKKNLEVSYLVDGVPDQPRYSREETFSVRFTKTYPMGWEHKKATLEINGSGTHCSRKVGFNTTHVKIRGKDLYVNGEPFLLKGIIPSFFEHKANLTWEEGLQQIKRTGTNTIRFYHTPTKQIFALCQELNLLIMSQPDDTTWDNLDITSSDALEDYIRRFRKHIHKVDGHPTHLLFNLGNELELKHKPEKAIPKLYDLINEASESSYYRFPTTYATFLTHLNHPADVLSINMLDSGKTYWERAIPMLGRLDKPFLATEFGGFVAFSERTGTNLRTDRMYRYWNALLQNHAIGAVFFQSHDNWAQPIPSGHNDPFSPDHIDDTRGYWTQENKEKPELYHLRQIFNDLPLRIIKTSEERLLLEAENIRPYKLTDVWFLADDVQIDLKTLSPNQKTTFTVPREKLVDNVLSYELKYATHRGLKQHFAHQYHVDQEALSPKISYTPLSQEYKTGKEYLPFENPISVPGKVTLKISLQETVDHSGAYLLLDGIGAREFTLVDEQGTHLAGFRAHYYREVFLELQRIRKYIQRGFLYIMINRNQTVYITRKDSPTGKPINISLSPVRFLLMRP